MSQLRMTPESREDVKSAARWYESQQVGLGREFITQLRDTFGIITPPIVSKDSSKNAPSAAAPVPYGVFFVAEAASPVVVLAVIDLRRHPKSWKSRT